MKVLFVESPPSLKWTPDQLVRTGGRRHPSKTVTGEMTYSYLNLIGAQILRDSGNDVYYIHSQTEGKTTKQTADEIKRISPDLTVFDVQHVKMNVDEYLSKVAKEVNSKTVWVGSFATPLHDQLIKKPSVDYVLRTEWDYALEWLVDNLRNNKAEQTLGLTYKRGKSIKMNRNFELEKDLDKLPFPAFDLIDIKKFIETVFLRLPCATTISSRGCPFSCIFCTFPNTIYTHKWRAQSAKRAFEEAKFLYDEFKVKEIRYDDDTFEVDKKRVFDFCKLLKKEDMDLTWQPQCRPDLMDDKMCKAMSDSGCVKILFGVESGDDDILLKVNKGMTRQQIKDGVMKARKHGIYLHNCFMIGFKWDTLETVKKTIDFAYELNGEFTQFAIATPLPGSPYYEMMDKQKLLVGSWCDRDSFFSAGVNLPNMSNEEINKLAKDAYANYYTRPEYISLMLKNSLRSKDHFMHMARLLTAFARRKKEGWI
jgi:anaerobic magnesium-protoporphyrin IX monomethyl ester cyclase